MSQELKDAVQALQDANTLAGIALGARIASEAAEVKEKVDAVVALLTQPDPDVAQAIADLKAMAAGTPAALAQLDAGIDAISDQVPDQP